MARRGSSLGFFGIFGRSEDLRQLDAAMRAADLHPALVPEGVKLTVVNLMKDRAGGDYPPAAAYAPVADLLAYCMLGEQHFARVNGTARTEAVEERIGAALGHGRGADAEIVLLTLHARLTEAGIIERYGLDIDTE